MKRKLKELLRIIFNCTTTKRKFVKKTKVFTKDGKKFEKTFNSKGDAISIKGIE